MTISTTISTTGLLGNLKSILAIDRLILAQGRPALTLLDPDMPPPCNVHPESTSVCVFRPCSHNVCAACLGISMMNNSECPACKSTVSRFVGFKKPIAKVHAGSGSEEGWTVEQKIVGVRVADENDDNVISLFLDEDRVCRVHGSKEIGASCFNTSLMSVF